MIQPKLKLNKLGFIIALVVVFFLGYGWAQSNFSQGGLFRVRKVIDGDTIEVQTAKGLEKVRLIGVDTPEIAHSPKEKNECFGPEAAYYTKKFLIHRSVYLLPDPLVSNRDKYHRLLRYVFLQDGTLFNAQLIKEGYGFDYIYQPFQFMKQFDYLEKQAREQKKGLWSSQCHYNFAE